MTNAEARCNKSLRPRKPEGSLGRTAQDVHLDSHTAPELLGGKRALFMCRVWQAQFLDMIHHILLLQHYSDLYEVTRH